MPQKMFPLPTPDIFIRKPQHIILQYPGEGHRHIYMLFFEQNNIFRWVNYF